MNSDSAAENMQLEQGASGEVPYAVPVTLMVVDPAKFKAANVGKQEVFNSFTTIIKKRDQHKKWLDKYGNAVRDDQGKLAKQAAKQTPRRQDLYEWWNNAATDFTEKFSTYLQLYIDSRPVVGEVKSTLENIHNSKPPAKKRKRNPPAPEAEASAK
jgi:hypothetical protein